MNKELFSNERLIKDKKSFGVLNLLAMKGLEPETWRRPWRFGNRTFSSDGRMLLALNHVEAGTFPRWWDMKYSQGRIAKFLREHVSFGPELVIPQRSILGTECKCASCSDFHIHPPLRPSREQFRVHRSLTRYKEEGFKTYLYYKKSPMYSIGNKEHIDNIVVDDWYLWLISFLPKVSLHAPKQIVAQRREQFVLTVKFSGGVGVVLPAKEKPTHHVDEDMWFVRSTNSESIDVVSQPKHKKRALLLT